MAPAEVASQIVVTVAYSAQPRSVTLIELRLAAGSTVADALQASGLADRHGVLFGEALQCSVWSKARPLTWVLRQADRVEVTRALQVDPKEARRQRYRQQPGTGVGRRASTKG